MVQRNKKYIDANKVEFSLFSSDEIKKLSVVSVNNPNSFNVLGHPLRGSLYDPALGPINEKSGPCATCLRNVFNCPGHFGHIELPLPVTNPLFHKIIYQILRMVCLTCHKLQLSGTVKYVLIAQLKLLDGGYVAECQELEMHLNKSLEVKNESSAAISQELWVKEQVEFFLDKVFSGGKKITSNFEQSKNIESLRNGYLQMVATHLNTKKCIQCSLPIRRIIFTKRRLLTNVLSVDVANKFADKSDQPASVKKFDTIMLMPDECRNHLREVWVEGKDFITAIIPVLKNSKQLHPTDCLFMDIIPVTPPKTRPVNVVNGKKVEHPQSTGFRKVVQDCLIIRNLNKVKTDGNSDQLSEEGKALVEALSGKSLTENIHNSWKDLQNHVDELVDSNLATEEMGRTGLKQIIEKKEGIIRMHMMGKRVNFAARSVITPDPNLDLDEIGVPEKFALTLTYPVPVTPWNANYLRQLIIRGPTEHPGAVLIEHEDGSLSKISTDSVTQRENVAKRLLTPLEKNSGGFKGVKYVHRHLHNGDILLMNRQPTLHKPSIMAHRARILKNEKTFRLHYSNCKAYNADFDGDEMNAHFPQNELARSEAYNLVNVPNQYLVPKDGSPLAGLIQDHMIAGVKLSLRGRFFSREDYYQFVFQAFPRVTTELKLLPPTILKPVPLWSGKQVLSTIIINITPMGKEPVSLHSSAKIGAKAWQIVKPRKWKAGGSQFTERNSMCESEVVIFNGELLCGVLDKGHYGPTRYGLVHCIYELYGPQCASKLLSSFTKLFTSFIQKEGFTLGIQDIIVLEEADKQRSSIICEVREAGTRAMASALDLKSHDKDEIHSKLLNVYGDRNAKWRGIIDGAYKQQLDSLTNNINRACLPSGLIQKFPDNNLQLMVQSGAKGSTVNTMQISCLLGQIELEGKRPPLMVSGKSLPSFTPFDLSPRAGGFIDGRFMTGIQPQEFFFHCMAGREGLIDTAVKTSRSGYLQRCLIKHLEGLVVDYDLTVRDSDKSVIQFFYGEDGLDIMKAQFLNEKQIPVLAQNYKSVLNQQTLNKLKYSEESLVKLVAAAKKTIPKWVYRSEYSATQGNRREINKLYPETIVSKFRPDEHFGAITERMESLILNYLEKRPTVSTKHLKKKPLRDMIGLKYMEAMCPPGEPVGIVAAQSIGEPSTQMTLNTFHFAGRGEMNVTLGIPRLREILMMASKKINTPSMEIPLHEHLKNPEAKANKLKKLLRRTTLADVLEYIEVCDYLDLSSVRVHVYELKFQFLPHYTYKSEMIVKPHDVLHYIEKKFIKNFFFAIKKAAKFKGTMLNVSNTLKEKSKVEDETTVEIDEEALRLSNIARKCGVGEEHESSDEEPEGEDDDATTARSRGRHMENQDYDEPEEEEEQFFKENDDEGIEEELVDEPNEMIQKEEKNADGVSFSKPTLQHLKELSRRCAAVLKDYSFVKDYKYDTENELWCKVTLNIPILFKRVDLSNLLKTEAEKAVIWETPNIKKAFTFVSPDSQKLILKTDGLNLEDISKYYKILDLNNLYSNDIYHMSLKYGIEAARTIIVKEVKDVFKMYGIDVDSRHLLLIADYMTFDGTFKPLSRKGMEDNCSPLQQMTFEASLTFIKNATLQGKKDDLRSPSSRIMVGRPCLSGTGSFGVLHKLEVPAELSV